MASRDFGYRLARADRVLVIAQRMRSGAWRKGDTKGLAVDHGVPLHVCEHDAADARVALRVCETLFADDLVRRVGALLKGD